MKDFDTKISKFLKKFKEYQNLRQQQQLRGLNDFNLFDTLLKPSDEVRLHSNFLHCLLDPNGSHCQGTLFLEKFFKQCELNSFELNDFNFDNCQVFKEYQNIDLYITDGTKHLIIENKIYAGDQSEQIQRYIKTIKEENPEADLNNNLKVIYLSLDRKEPSKYSLGNFEINGDKLVNGDEEYSFKSIHYNHNKKGILEWIRIVKKEVANLTNLALVLEQYEEIILKLYNRYIQKTMTLIKFIEKQDLVERKEMLQMIQDIVHKEYPNLRIRFIKKFLTISAEKINDKLPDDWQVDFEEDKINQRYSKPLTIHKINKEENFCFALDFVKNNALMPYLGILGNDEKITKNDEIKNLLTQAKLKFPLEKETEGWIAFKFYPYQGPYADFFQLISEKGVEKASDDFVADFYKIFETYKEVVIKCQEFLPDFKTAP